METEQPHGHGPFESACAFVGHTIARAAWKVLDDCLGASFRKLQGRHHTLGFPGGIHSPSTALDRKESYDMSTNDLLLSRPRETDSRVHSDMRTMTLHGDRV